MKKIAAILLAGVMCIGMSTSVFADSNQSVVNGGNFTVGKTYTINKGTAPSESFELENVTLSKSENVAKESDKNLIPTVTKTNSINTGEATFSISLPTYTGVGEFTYSFNEKNGGTAGVTYDTATYYLVVQVVNAETSGFSCNVAIHKGSATGEKVTGITNTYDSGTLAVSKSVTGNMGDKTKEFNVTVTFTAPANETVKSTIGYTEDSMDKTVTFAEGATTATATIALKDGETVTFTNIPAGVTYTVEESNYTGNNGGYDVASYEYSDKGETKTISANDNDTVAITNNKGTTVDTGVNMDKAPYMVIFAVVVIGAAVVITRKKFSAED